MKANNQNDFGKQKAAYVAVKLYRINNPNVFLRDAITAVSKEMNSSYDSVRSAYYTHAHRNGDPIARRKNAKSQANRNRKPSNLVINKIPEESKATDNVDVNVVRTSLRAARISLDNALKTIDTMERQNRKNEEIISSLRSLLSVKI